MKPSEFSPAAPGRVVRSLEGHWTFEPNPLPPIVDHTRSLSALLSRADLALGKLSMAGSLIPNPHLWIRPFIRREAVLSSKIEGTVTRLDQLLLFEAASGGAPDEDMAEVSNYVKALQYGLAQVEAGVPLCLRLLREVHAHLMDGVLGANMRPGQFRQCAVYIGRAGQNKEQSRFIPPAHQSLDDLLRDFERFLNDPGEMSVVEQVALAHYQFEAIHPFMDGNGRLGRLLIPLLLCERKVLSQPLLYLSAYLEEHDEEYRNGLLAISQRGEWTEWVRFIAIGVTEQAEDAVKRSQQLLELRQQYRARAQDSKQVSVILTLIDQLFAAPAVTIAGAEMLMGVTYPTAQKYVNWMVSEGMLREVTGQTRNRVYMAPEIFRLLGATPPEG